MIKKIIDRLNNFHSKFTYRQRFLVFAFIYFIGMPLPTSWTLRTQNFYIIKSEQEINAIRYSSTLTAALSQILQYQVLTFDPTPASPVNQAHLQELKKGIQVNLEALSLIEAPPESPNLGKAFSETSTPKHAPQAIQKEWSKIINFNGPWQNTKHFFSKLIFEISRQLRDLRNSLQPILEADSELYTFINITLKVLPKIEILTARIAITLEQIKIQGLASEEQSIQLLAMLQQINEEVLMMDKALRKSADLAKTENQAVLAKLIQNLQEHQILTHPYLNLSHPAISPTFENIPLAINSLHTYAQYQQDGLDWIFSLFSRKQLYLKLLYGFTLIILISFTLLVLLYVLVRPLSKHLNHLLAHVVNLGKGNFSKCFCSKNQDEFGEVGKALDQMGAAIHIFLEELLKLGHDLSEFTSQIAKTASEEQVFVTEREASIQSLEGHANQIAQKSKSLAAAMNELSTSTEESALADSTQSNLKNMQEKMAELSSSSTAIEQKLAEVQEKLSQANSSIPFMGMVSHQANLLSLNAAIETATLHSGPKNFIEISQKIQYFADNANKAANNIQKIINEISLHISTIRVDSRNWLNEISDDAQRLITVSHQLSNIDKQREEQHKKFTSLNELLQNHAAASETILSSFMGLIQLARKNTQAILHLQQTIEKFGAPTHKLQKILTIKSENSKP